MMFGCRIRDAARPTLLVVDDAESAGSGVQSEIERLASVLGGLETAHPGFRERLFDDQGELRRFVNVFVDDEDIRFLDGVNTDVKDGATVSIVPAVAGG